MKAATTALKGAITLAGLVGGLILAAVLTVGAELVEMLSGAQK